MCLLSAHARDGDGNPHCVWAGSIKGWRQMGQMRWSGKGQSECRR